MSYFVVTITEDGDLSVEELGVLAMSERLAEWTEVDVDVASFLGEIPDRDPNYWATKSGLLNTTMRVIIKGTIVKPEIVSTVTKLGLP